MRNEKRHAYRRKSIGLVRTKVLLILVSCAATATVLADMPLPPPALKMVPSRNLKFAARSDPQTNQTVVYRYDSASGVLGEALWSFSKWFRDFEISNDGRALVAETDYLSLLPRNIPENHVLLAFIVNGKIIRKITIQQLFGSRSKLQPTPLNVDWGRGLYGIDENGFAFVDTVIGFFIFDAQTGKCVFPPNNHVD